MVLRCRNWVALVLQDLTRSASNTYCHPAAPMTRRHCARRPPPSKAIACPVRRPPVVHPVSVVPGAARLGVGCTRTNCRQQSRSPMRGDRLVESKSFYCVREQYSHADADGCSVCCPSAPGQQVPCVETVSRTRESTCRRWERWGSALAGGKGPGPTPRKFWEGRAISHLAGPRSIPFSGPNGEASEVSGRSECWVAGRVESGTVEHPAPEQLGWLVDGTV